MKNRLLLFFFVLLSVSVAAQQTQVSPWKSLFENSAVKFEARIINCQDAELATDHEKQLIRITNQTDRTLTVSWLNALFYDHICLTCDNLQEYTNTLVLQPGASISGDCQSEHRFLAVFSSDNQNVIKSKLTDFKIYQVVTSLNPKN